MSKKYNNDYCYNKVKHNEKKHLHLTIDKTNLLEKQI